MATGLNEHFFSVYARISQHFIIFAINDIFMLIFFLFSYLSGCKQTEDRWVEHGTFVCCWFKM